MSLDQRCSDFDFQPVPQEIRDWTILIRYLDKFLERGFIDIGHLTAHVKAHPADLKSIAVLRSECTGCTRLGLHWFVTVFLQGAGNRHAEAGGMRCCDQFLRV